MSVLSCTETSTGCDENVTYDELGAFLLHHFICLCSLIASLCRPRS
jgi:hypothetical protein